jgi:hypothetical protein
MPESGSDSGHGLHFLRSGSPKEIAEVITEMRHASTICHNIVKSEGSKCKALGDITILEEPA